MWTRRTIAGCVAIVSSAATLLTGQAAQAGTVTYTARYASPTGPLGASCAKAHPCAITTAINDAPDFSKVLLQSGTYGSSQHQLTTELQSAAELEIEGGSATRPATIWSSAPTVLQVTTAPSDVADVVIHGSGGIGGFTNLSGVTASHLEVLASFADSACTIGGVLVDSVCVNSGPHDDAIDDTFNGTAAISGVTAIESGMGGDALVDEEDNAATSIVDVSNSILRGAGDDVAVIQPAGTASVQLTNSDYRPAETATPQGGTITHVPSDISANPLFVDATANNYREQIGSPTINRGKAVHGQPGTDLAGEPRVLGRSQDIGAYEFVPAPAIGRITVSHRSSDALRIRIPVNPEGLPTQVRAVATHGTATLHSHWISVGHGRASRRITLTVRGLTARTSYLLVVTARNKGGQAHAHRRAHTAA